MKTEIIGNATLYLGDCLEILPTLPHFDLILTDPPYGLGIDGQEEDRKSRNPKHNRKGYEFLGWDGEPPSRYAFEMMYHKSKHQIIWGGNYFVDRLRQGTKGWLFWDKGQRGLTMSDGEFAYTSFDFPSRAITINRVELQTDGAEHPTQKPLRLMSWCLGLAPQCVTVCDPFMGSGTTGVACMQAGRQFVGIEREEKYYDIARRRIEDSQRQCRLIA
jgi:site-specific DNA-methyltransferase (adenine-specific)